MRTYYIPFDKTKYDIHGYGWWNFSKCDNNNNNVLSLYEAGFIIDNNKIPYTKEEQDIKSLCSYLKNDIKYFMKQCLIFRRLLFTHVLKY